MYEFLFCLLAIGISLWWSLGTLKYWFSGNRTKDWPRIEGWIQAGSTGPVSVGKAAINGCFLGYAFKLDGQRYAGYFVIFCDEEKSSKFQKSLPGSPVTIRYNPADPNISYLDDKNDARFGWQGASQDPDYLSQAPAFDLADAMRK